MNKKIIIVLLFALAIAPAVASAEPIHNQNHSPNFNYANFHRIHHNNLNLYHNYPSTLNRLAACENKINRIQNQIDTITNMYGDDTTTYPYFIAIRYDHLVNQLNNQLDRYDSLVAQQDAMYARHGLIGYRY